MKVQFSLAVLTLTSALSGQQNQAASTAAGDRIVLEQLANGARVILAREVSGDWGIQISGGAAPRLMQPKPKQIEIYRGGEDVSQLAAGYQSVQKEGGAVLARAKVAGGGEAAFAVEDHWKVSGCVLSLSRTVSVTGAEGSTGFYSAIRLSTAPTVAWTDLDYLVPGLLYGEPHTRTIAELGGQVGHKLRRHAGLTACREVLIREDTVCNVAFSRNRR
jgi:hypothetical protein